MPDNFSDRKPKTELDRPKSKFKFINQTKGVTMLPVNDLEDVLMSACDFANDINNKAGLIGFLDNLPGVYAAYDGVENVFPQAADVDSAELAGMQAKIKERLSLSVSTEALTEKGITALWAIGEFIKEVQAAKTASAT